jgi:hypothetical protein
VNNKRLPNRVRSDIARITASSLSQQDQLQAFRLPTAAESERPSLNQHNHHLREHSKVQSTIRWRRHQPKTSESKKRSEIAEFKLLITDHNRRQSTIRNLRVHHSPFRIALDSNATHKLLNTILYFYKRTITKKVLPSFQRFQIKLAAN